MPQIDFATYGPITFWQFFIILFFFYLLSDQLSAWFSSNYSISIVTVFFFKKTALTAKNSCVKILKHLLKNFY